MRKKILVFTFVALLAFICIGTLKIRANTKIVTQKVEQHLSVSGYKPNEYQVNVNYHLGNMLLGYDPYNIKVVYSNEPDINYYYEYNSKTHIIIQSGVQPIKETDKKDFKHVK